MNSYPASHIYCPICWKFGRGRPEPKAFALVRLIRIAEGKAVIPFWETKQITLIRLPRNFKSKQRLGELRVL